MFNLENSGLNLRTIKPAEYSKVLEDINYNFIQFLNLPGFRGRQGESITGPAGPSTRGSKWCFARFIEFSAVYTEITSADEINLQFLNMSFADNPEKLFSAMYIPNDTELIIGDLVVLPSGQIVELVVNSVTSNIEFNDTGITFAQVTQITEQQIIDLINSIVQPTVSNDSFRHFVALAKNASDASPSLNNSLTQTAVIDPKTSNSGPGYPMADYTFVAPTELNVPSLTQMMLVAGSVSTYHNLVQGTQTTLTNEYAPQVNSFGALTVLQNNYNNGILLGNKNETTFRSFARLYKNSNSVVLTSSYSPLISEYSEINLSNTELTFRVNSRINVNSPEFIATNVDVFNTKHFNYTGTQLFIGKASTNILEFNANTIRFNRNVLKSANFLSTNANGDIIKTYSTTGTLNSSTNESQILNGKALYEIINGLQTQINQNTSSNSYKSIRRYRTGTYSVNDLKDFGVVMMAKEVNILNLPQYVVPPNPVQRPADVVIITQPVADDASVPNNLNITSYMQEIYVPKLVSINAIYGNSSNGFTAVEIEGTPLVLGQNAEIIWDKYVRWGTKQKDTGTTIYPITWVSIWTRYVTMADRIKSSGGVTISGSFTTQDLSIRHSSKASTLVDSVNSGTTVIQSMRFDSYGHPRTVVTKDLSTEFISRNASLKDFDYTQDNTLADSLTAINEMNKTKQIQTSTLVIGDTNNNNVWINANNSPVNGVLAWNNLPQYNTVQYSYERLSATQMLVYLKTAYTAPSGPDFVQQVGESWVVDFSNHTVTADLIKHNTVATLNSIKANASWQNASKQYSIQRVLTSDYPQRRNSSNQPIKTAVFLVTCDEATTQPFSILFTLNRYTTADSNLVFPQ